LRRGPRVEERAVLESDLRRLLREAIGGDEWATGRPGHGQQKECYVARSPNRTVFLKFDGDAPVAALRRLGELRVAPRLLAHGREPGSGRAYTIQEFVAGSHPPGWRWFGDNLPLLAETTRRYQTDAELRRLAGRRCRRGERQRACLPGAPDTGTEGPCGAMLTPGGRRTTGPFASG